MKDAEHSGPAYENRQRMKTAGEGTNSRAAFGVSVRTGGQFFEPERYGTKITEIGESNSARAVVSMG
jgi:hypothetical protein